MNADRSLCMRLQHYHEPLVRELRAVPEPGPRQLLLRVRACGVCRTDLHIVDGELPPGPLPIVPGHEIVGEVIAAGAGSSIAIGTRVGVPWLATTCRRCAFCLTGRENLCDAAQFTGYQLDGGYAQHAVADSDYCFELPDSLDDAHAAPLLCAGLIGYRSWKMAGEARRLGLYGFGAAAHLIAQMALSAGQEVYALTRPGDLAAQEFARRMGACWAGDSDRRPPVELDAAIILAPVGALVPAALQALRKGGTCVLGGIHMSDLPPMPYSLLWGERVLRSVANLTRQDGRDFFSMLKQTPLHTQVEEFPLTQANLALQRLRSGSLTGAAVLMC